MDDSMNPLTQAIYASRRKNPLEDNAFIQNSLKEAKQFHNVHGQVKHTVLNLVSIIEALQRENTRLHNNISKRVFDRIQKEQDKGQ